MKAVIINNYGGAEVLQYADIGNLKSRNDQLLVLVRCYQRQPH